MRILIWATQTWWVWLTLACVFATVTFIGVIKLNMTVIIVGVGAAVVCVSMALPIRKPPNA